MTYLTNSVSLSLLDDLSHVDSGILTTDYLLLSVNRDLFSGNSAFKPKSSHKKEKTPRKEESSDSDVSVLYWCELMHFSDYRYHYW